MSARSECPKCGATPTEGAANCAKCGLAVDRMDAFAQKREADVPTVVRAAWDALHGAWEDDARHTAFLRIVVDENAFAWAAQQYRDKKPDARAEAMLERVRKAAEARLAASATRKPEAKTVMHSVKILVGAMVLMVIAGLLILQFLKGKQHATQPARAPAGQVR